MPTLLDGSDVDQQQGGVAPGLLNEGSPVSNDRGPLGMLFPSGPYGNVPGLNLKSLRRSQLLELGARLIAGSGPKPQGTSSALSDVGQAVGGSMQDWRQQLPQAANSAMQLIQFQYQMQGRQALMTEMQKEGALAKDASPTEAVAWYSRMARRLSEAGPVAMPYAQQFASLAETTHRSLGDLKYEDGVVTPEMAQGNPKLAPYVGQYGSVGHDPNTGAAVVFQPKPRLTPEQTASKQIELRTKYQDEVKPGNTAALAYKAYQDIPKNDTSRAADMQRSQLAARMLGEGGAVPGLSPAESKDLKEMVMELFTNAGRLDPGSRQRYDATVQKAATYWKRHNAAIHDYYTNTAPDGVDTSRFRDEWADQLTPSPTAAPGTPAPAGKVTKAIGAP
jgi:hypothetical protein